MLKSNRGSNGSLPRVLIAVVLVAFLLPMSGCTTPIDGNDVEKIVVQMSTTQTVKRDTEDIWDTTSSINKITPKDSTVKWSDMSVVIKDFDGSVLLTKTRPSSDTGTYGDSIEVWYIDSAGEGNAADPGDIIKITGMDDGYEGANIEITYKGNQIASMRLTTDFS